jgi:hypothetical protein
VPSPDLTVPIEPHAAPPIADALVELNRLLTRLAEALERSAAPPIVPLVTRRDLARVARVSLRVVDQLRASDQLPKPDLVINRRSPRWRVATIEAWLAQQAAAGKGGRHAT